MKIAFTHNLKLSEAEEEAEFDTPETVQAIAKAIESLGHVVELVEVSGPPSRTIARLEALNPDLVFNTAEGRSGRYREAFYPGVFEELGLCSTGSDAYVCALTLDKQLTKLVVAPHGVPTPRWKFVRSEGDLKNLDLRFPLMIKPNYEGSSKGITQDSVVETPERLQEIMGPLLKKYTSGLLVEEYIDGKDVTVPFLEHLPGKIDCVLPPMEYRFSDMPGKKRKYQIYDYDLKNVNSQCVEVRTAELPPETLKEIRKHAATVFRVLGIRDFGRADFRLTPDGRLYFIEVNALPSLEPGAGIYDSAKLVGVATVEEVLKSILHGAAKRQGISRAKGVRRPAQKNLRVGLAFNLKRVVPGLDPQTDGDAEYDSPKTVKAIREAIESYGHEVVELEAVPEITSRLPSLQLDVVFNIAEGIKGRNRESQIPAMLELLDIPYTGSDPATLSLTLDKGLAKRIVREAGIPTAPFLLMHTGKEKIPADLQYPLFVKPVAEGSSKGILTTGVIHNEKELREAVVPLIQKYKQPVLVEAFLSGREFTVALLGEKRPKVLPPMEIVFNNKDNPTPVYAYQHKVDSSKEVSYDTKPALDPALRQALEQTARKAFHVLGCRDVARIDLRLDHQGVVNFIECNPLPGLTPGWSDLCTIADAAGIEYRNLVGEILAPAIRRFRDKRKMLLPNL